MSKTCTNNGMKAAQTMRSSIKRGLCPADNVITGTGRNSIRESDMGDYQEHLRNEAMAGLSLARLDAFIAGHVPALVTSDLSHVSVDRLVVLEYEDSKGETVIRRFVIGGEDEPQLYTQQGIQVIYYGSPLGKALINRTVGNEVTIMAGGQEYDATVVGILLTPEPDLEMTAPDAQQQLPLSSAA